MDDEFVNVRYMVDDVESAVAFYTTHFGFELRTSSRPRLPTSSGATCVCSERPHQLGRAAHAGRSHSEPGGWNRIHLIVENIAGEVERLRAAGLRFRSDIVSGPGGQQILIDDPAGNPIRALPAGRPRPNLRTTRSDHYPVAGLAGF